MKPVCKICQREHWPRDPHMWEGRDFRVLESPPEPTKVEAPPTPKNEPKVAPPEDPGLTAKADGSPLSKNYVPVKKWRRKNREKYNSYMRELMRKRREIKP